MENLPSEDVKKPETPAKLEDKPKRASLDFQDQIYDLIPTAGTIEIEEWQKKILFASVKDEDVEIRPDGLIYLPWMEYVSRLRDAFGISWALIPQGSPRVQDNHILWGFWLIIKGKPAGFAVGEQEYFPGSARMSYSDALEGSKSNSLMRLCKGLGISLELWRPSFVRGWKEKYAESYEDVDRNGKKRVLWRKKGNGNAKAPDPIDRTPPNAQDAPGQEIPGESISEAQRKRFWAIAKSTKATDDQIKDWLYREYDIQHTQDIPKSLYDEVCQRVKTDLEEKGE